MESALQYQGEIENNGYATARKSLARAGGGGGVNMLHYGLCDNGELCF